MMKREWAATSSNLLLDTNYCPCSPKPPEGDGWRLVSAVTYVQFGPLAVAWYWEREVSSDAVP